MRLVDLYPMRGTFSPGESIQLMVKVDATKPAEGMICLSLYHLAEEVMENKVRLELSGGMNDIPLEFDLQSREPWGYGVRAELVCENENVVGSAETAFDVINSWSDFPRYGFLTDFAPEREDMVETIEDLVRFHINGLQFYDWQYRHDQLLSPTEIYVDPMGRQLSLDTVRGFINSAQEHGIKTMSYLAIYAASMSFWAKHPSWHLLDAKGKPVLFENFLGLMNPSKECAWIEHLLSECEQTLEVLDFDGLHIDQYGEPKVGYDAEGREVDIPIAFYHFIVAAKERLPESTLTFNAVSNWPIDALTSAPLDFNYIEIWSDTPTFQDLHRLALEARSKSGNNPLIFALYLPADQDANIRLADAIIFASGACRIELGERARILTDPYFPKHKSASPELLRILRRYYDFAVRYGEWIGPSALDVPELVAELPKGVWGVVREVNGFLILNLINMTGLNEACWNVDNPAPEPLSDFSIRIASFMTIQEAWWASPDSSDLRLKPAPWRVEGRGVVVNVPYLEYWTMVSIQIGNLP